MWRAHHTRRFAARTLFILGRPAGVLAAVLGLAAARPGLAQLSDANAPRSADQLARPASISPGDAMSEYSRIEAWVREMAVPEVPAPPACPPCPAAVTLRLRGQVVGRGQSAASTNAVIEAARWAIQSARDKLSTPRDEDGLILREIDAPDIQVSLEIAGPLVPIAPATFEDADRELSPGLDGVGVRIGARTELVFPGAMGHAGMSPGDALASAIARAANDPTLGLRENPAAQPGTFAAAHGATVYRFRVVHVAQIAPGSAPVFLHRGQRVVSERQITLAGLRSFADELAVNLARRVTKSDRGWRMAGTPFPSLGQNRPEEAPPLERALAAYALAVYADQAESAPARSGALEAGRGLLLSLTAPEPGAGENPLQEAAVAALVSLALDAADWDAGPVSLEGPSAVFDPIDTGKDAGKEVRSPAAGEFAVKRASLAALSRSALTAAALSPDSVPSDHRGVIACALASRARSLNDAVWTEAAKARVAQVLERTGPGELVSQMPWVGWAELDLADATGGTPASAPALRDMRDLVYGHVLDAGKAGPDGADLVGGVVFTRSGPELPTWHSARPAAFLATMLADPRLTAPGERVKETARLLPVLRFLRQLAADEAVAATHAERDNTVWGVRAATWDQRQPADATAMTLLAVCESVRALEGRPRPLPRPPTHEETTYPPSAK